MDLAWIYEEEKRRKEKKNNKKENAYEKREIVIPLISSKAHSSKAHTMTERNDYHTNCVPRLLARSVFITTFPSSSGDFSVVPKKKQKKVPYPYFHDISFVYLDIYGRAW